MLQYTICAFLAPALVSAAAFLSSGPQPTRIRPEPDNWSPAPTVGPQLDAIELLRRDVDGEGGGTCGFVSGNASQPVTCQRSDFACATDRNQGVRGCCDPNNIKACIIPTNCIPSKSLSKSCDEDCSSNSAIQKCTDSNMPECYQRTYIYPTKPDFYEYGCATSAFAQVVSRFIQNDTSTSQSPLPISGPTSTEDLPSSATTSPTSTSEPAPQKTSSKAGPIAGGVVGGLGAIAIGISLFYLGRRSKKIKPEVPSASAEVTEMPGHDLDPTMTDYKSPVSGFSSPGQYGQDNKPWGPGYGPYSPQSPYSPYSPPAELPPNVIAEMGAEASWKKPKPKVYAHEMPASHKN